MSDFLFVLTPDGGELRQQLVALRVGQRLTLTVESVTENEATFKSDELSGATFLADKHHMASTY